MAVCSRPTSVLAVGATICLVSLGYTTVDVCGLELAPAVVDLGKVTPEDGSAGALERYRTCAPTCA